jgi:hypothetical protein
VRALVSTSERIVLRELQEIRGKLVLVNDEDAAIIQCVQSYHVALDEDTAQALKNFVGSSIVLVRMNGKTRWRKVMLENIEQI